ncbi:hypothetical protein HN51_048134 [Arachis hypogaea]|uniref:Legume lectin domain-containing protein n=3 Tax=Arachis TaxID=3817 RepID=A0A445EBP9_ARAHY|nr:L-type lectin-domain containing receptor kinase VIII.2 [Arachis duranensis]XP_025633592.1 L-type lectin-domain containing receptor kinase VIII.2 [Arachis hypogaea]XP_025653240.1 L-type lectin-domain containing receptor kinase VIII.2 [Arachis hypogaea]QHO53983.1 L-type lectin-domain containing receptor kinase VIII [Arachis hypogaea]RYR72729.1 hypothetical protein Ahy_A02g006943 isoform B [Arachis hypogaea]
MAHFTTSPYFKALTLTILFLKTQAFDPIPLFSFAEFEKDPKFKSNVALFGGSKVMNGGSGIQLSGSGKVMYKRPIKLLEGKPKQLASFSTYFTFSTPLYNRGGLAFVMVPNGSKSDFFEKSSSGYPSLLKNGKSGVVGVEFSPSTKGGHVSCSVAINVGDPVIPARAINKSFNWVAKNGEKFHAWIDYVASSRQLEVRLSQHGNTKPYDPFLWHKIDLAEVLKEKQFFVGLSPMKLLDDSSSYESQAWFLYSWSFVVRKFPHTMHSEPLDPKVLVKTSSKGKNPVVNNKPRNDDCILKVLSAMIFGTGCGALTAFVVLYLWTIFGGNRRPVVPEECVMQHDVEYRKVKIVVDNKTIEDGKN